MEEKKEGKGWADAVVDGLLKRERKEYVCEGMWTPSGHCHIGNARTEIFTPYCVCDALLNRGYKAKQNFIIDDFDAVRKIPLDLGLTDEQKKEYLGHPCALAPSPVSGYKTWAEAFVAPLKEAIGEFGVKLNIQSAHETYKSGKLNDLIKISLDHAKEIVAVWNRISGAEKPSTFLPIQVFCDSCGRIFFTEATSWDGKEVEYSCKNCNNKGKKSPLNGNAKLHWRVHWAAFWVLNKVDFESAGKDHFSRGGSVDVGHAMMREVFKTPPPYQIPTEFVQIKGAKMAGSVGNVINLQDWLEVASPELFRYLNLSYKPNKVIEFSFNDNSFVLLNDRFERAERIYYGKETAENKKIEVQLKRAYELSKIKPPEKKLSYQLPFSFAVQLNQLLEPEKQFDKLIESLKETGHLDKKPQKQQLEEIRTKLSHAKTWLEKYAPEQYKLSFLETPPKETILQLPKETKAAMNVCAERITAAKNPQEIQQAVFDTAKDNNINPKELFQAMYLVLLGKKAGPKIGSLAAVLGKGKIIKRLKETASL